MTPSLPIATDNIYKFACLFGLALVVSCVLAFVSMYSSSLDRKVRYHEAIVQVEQKADKSKADENVIAMHKQLINVTKENESFANTVLAGVLAVGLCLSGYGATQWYRLVQKRDDRIANLQIAKLEQELIKLRSENAKAANTGHERDPLDEG